jgi:hypothetical protein
MPKPADDHSHLRDMHIGVLMSIGAGVAILSLIRYLQVHEMQYWALLTLPQSYIHG